MRSLFIVVAAAAVALSCKAEASQADDTSVVIVSDTAGPTPFISNVAVTVSDPGALASVQFVVAPKSGSVTRPVSAAYGVDYLLKRGFLSDQSRELTVPVFGLYSDYQNNVSLTFFFSDHSTKRSRLVVTTAAYDDPCGFDKPTVRQQRTSSTQLSYDYTLVISTCSQNSPTILDTDGAIRWVGAVARSSYAGAFYDNAIYVGQGSQLFRSEMDGTVTMIRDYADQGFRFHHNIDRGKRGLIVEVDTPRYVESVDLEIDPSTGEILKEWNMGKIISAAMTAGGDDPTLFVKKSDGDDTPNQPDDWWHNNAVAYRRSDDSVIISSRENFLVCLDYKTNAIKWILGDRTKQWYQFASLRKFALKLAPGTLPPLGQHAVSVSKDDNLLLMDNGQESLQHEPVGQHRSYAAPREYSLNLRARVASEVWNYPNGESIFSPYCGSVYEDARRNYLVDYAIVGGFTGSEYADILGLSASGEKVFEYSYPSGPCNVAYRSLPIHLERLLFTVNGSTDSDSAVLHQLNMSARSLVMGADNVGIAGFIITGNQPKDIAIRGLGPSLPISGSAALLGDPTLTLYDKANNVIEFNNNYTDGPFVDALNDAGLLPSDKREAAILRKQLPPGEYTAVMRGVHDGTGIGLVEVYDVSAGSDSKLGNLSSRAFVSTGDNVLIGGVLVRGGFPQRVLFRALGPELQVPNPLHDTTLDLYNRNGTVIASNDDWMDSADAQDIEDTGAAPTDPRESAILVPLDAGEYTAIVRGKDNTTGIGLLESYQRELKD
jgi:hypothetical protein